jgi:O-antigen ligase
VLTGVVVAGLWVAFMLARTTWGLGAASATGFDEVTMVRGVFLSGLGLRANWNTLAFICVGAAGIAAARAVIAQNKKRFLHAAIALAAIFAVFLTISRSGVASLAVTLGYVFYALMSRKLFLRLSAVALATMLLIALAVPRVVFDRFTFSLAYDASGRREARAMVYSTAVRYLPEYFTLGVGERNFWEWWAIEHGLEAMGETIGAHNGPLQILLYWGLPGLLCWLALMFVAWRTLAAASRNDLRRVALTAFCLSVFMSSLASHDLSDKEYSMALGLIAGAFEIRRRQVLARHRGAAQMPAQAPPRAIAAALSSAS